ncbi:MAG: ribonuclease E [Rhodobacteraceae bacterium HLUCCO07]|nr:MAG: ribonuclease E [Rhodobacteraceae bacterium HLUCCO07]
MQMDHMAKKMLIDATHAEETRVVVVDGNKVEEFDFESENKRQLAGNIYLAKVTRVEPSLQAAFVDYGGNRHGFLAFSEIHPDYYQIPVADRERLMEEERAYVEALKAREDEEEKKPSRSRSRRSSSKKSSAEAVKSDDAVASTDAKDEGSARDISGMETIDLEGDEVPEGTSPMDLVGETPVEEPDETTNGDSDNGAGHDEAQGSDAAAKDDSIESVADDDDSDDIRPPRKPRARRYKIQEVIKVRQILLVQVVKEERGNKGAALTTYLSLAGRYCVLMPNTARGGGISRKITNAPDRKKLKEIANEIDVPQGAGLIIRTAGAKRTKSEIKRDYEYLQRLWEQIRELTLKSIAPAKIYEEGDLIKRSIRDLYNREIDEVLVEGERGYRIAKDFMKMIMPSHAKNVKHYHEGLPLFARFQVESYLSSMFNPSVQLKSGGYIVIGVTEALVAIDVNSGRATKEGSIEETALKTNLEAADEVARQLRLRDLAGLIVIDFIDMDERRNNAAVEKRIKEKLKTDRARIQVGRISGFGLMEMSRQRLRPGMIEATTQPCPHCHGTGLIRSDDSLALSILRQIEEEGTRGRSREVLVKCPVGIANFLMNQKREHIAQIEARYTLSVRVEGDPMLISPDFSLEKFKTASRVVADPGMHVVSVDTSLMDAIDSDSDVEAESETQPSQAESAQNEGEEEKPKKRRRRRRRSRSSKSGNGAEAKTEDRNAEPEGEQAGDAVAAGPADDAAKEPASETPDAPKARSPRSSSKSKSAAKPATEKAEPVGEDATVDDGKTAELEGQQPKTSKPRTSRSGTTVSRTRSKSTAKSSSDSSKTAKDAPQNVTDADMAASKPEEAPKAKPKRKAPTRSKTTKAAAVSDTASETEAKPNGADDTAQQAPKEPAPEKPSETVAARAGGGDAKMAGDTSSDSPTTASDDTGEAEAEKPTREAPKKRGWWSLGRG